MPNLVLADNLNPQRRAFVDHYTTPGTTTFGNATRSAVAAGYSEATANEQGSQLLVILSVREAVAERLKTLEMSHAETRARIAEIATFDASAFVTFEEVAEMVMALTPVAEAAQMARAEHARAVEVEHRMSRHDRAELKARAARLSVLDERAVTLELHAIDEPDAMVPYPQPRTRRVPRIDFEKAEREGVLHLVAGLRYDTEGRLIPDLPSRLEALKALDKGHLMLAKLQADEGQGGEGGEGDALTTARQKLRAGAPVVVAAPGSTVNVQINTPKP